MGEIVDRAAAWGGGKEIKKVSKAKGEAKFDGVAQSFCKGVGHKLDSLQTRGISMMGSMRLIRIV